MVGCSEFVVHLLKKQTKKKTSKASQASSSLQE